MKTTSRAVLLLWSLLLLACSDSEDSLAPRALLVYLGGDSNLSGEVLSKITAIQGGWQRRDVPVIIYRDDASARGSFLARLAGQEGWPLLDTIATYAEENSAAPGTLKRVVETLRSRFPARSYGLLLFSHASGWLPPGTLENPLADDTRSLVVDEGDGTRREMTLDE
ncbi:MAG: hypothetical protein LBD64_02120, partial [Odoribacteraceae bacterium]|nr:hypothetical protein [Odoribacteraceae bacterium]